MARIEEFEFPDDLFYDTKEHLWLRPQGALITIGVDDGGQDALGDVVYVQLTEAGRQVSRGEAIGSVEAAKMVRPLLAPLSGRLTEVNSAVMAKPRLLNEDPYGQGWLFRIEADHWDSERLHFIQGSEAVTAWVRSELAAHGRR
jgi:glycine cleavage system H protein